MNDSKGLFLDLDGTLANSMTLLKDVYFSFLNDRGANGSEIEFQRLNGLPFAEMIEKLNAAHKLCNDVAELSNYYSAMIREAHASALPSPGARELLARARSNGWKVAVVTSARRLWALEWLDRNAFLSQMDAVVGDDDVACGKPSPEPYRLALFQTGCVPARSLAVEDSRHGARAALSAGLSTWVIESSGGSIDWPTGVNIVAGLNELTEKL